MKILYAVQGTGNGHLSRAMEIAPVLKQYAETDLLVSGIDSDLKLPFPVKYRYHGLGFVFGKNGGIDLLATYRKNKIKTLLEEIKSVPIEDYDLIINDFEPVSAWAAYQRRRPIVGFGNQHSLLSDKSPKAAKRYPIGEMVIKWYAPTATWYGFHFRPYDTNIFTPTIRSIVRDLTPTNKGHYTVYLPAYSEQKVIKILSQISQVRWEVFSKEHVTPQEVGNILFKPIDAAEFLHSMAACTGVLTGGGFATPSEALFLEKKLMVIPMKGQYEQQCNVAALNQIGIHSLKSLKTKHIPLINDWVQNANPVTLDFPDNSALIIEKILEDFKLGKIKNTQDEMPSHILSVYGKFFGKKQNPLELLGNPDGKR
ncbi:MAG: hypothetical protein JXR34_00210 [Bacteroidales bacterium]|nr:hypothetical protein [Bacteroidales bacterium]